MKSEDERIKERSRYRLTGAVFIIALAVIFLPMLFDAEGLGPWYALANSFINTVLNKDPWGKIGLLRYLEYLRYLVVLFICDLWVVIF